MNFAHVYFRNLLRNGVEKWSKDFEIFWYNFEFRYYLETSSSMCLLRKDAMHICNLRVSCWRASFACSRCLLEEIHSLVYLGAIKTLLYGRHECTGNREFSVSVPLSLLSLPSSLFLSFSVECFLLLPVALVHFVISLFLVLSLTWVAFPRAFHTE